MGLHKNNGHCGHCAEIFDRYPGFNGLLRSWFTMLQARHPEAHISCAGRGADEQNAKVQETRSKAVYGRSAHNWNAAIDVFCQISGTDIYDEDWFNDVLAPEIPDYLKWYGVLGSPYYELPHIELKEWKKLMSVGILSLVEAPQKKDVA